MHRIEKRARICSVDMELWKTGVCGKFKGGGDEPAIIFFFLLYHIMDRSFCSGPNRELITKEGPSQIERLFHLYLFSFSSTTAYLHESKRSVNKGSGAGMESLAFLLQSINLHISAGLTHQHMQRDGRHSDFFFYPTIHLWRCYVGYGVRVLESFK